MKLQCDTCRLFARERGVKIIDLRDSVSTSKDDFKFLESQITLKQKEKEALDFDRDACKTNLSHLQKLLKRYRGAFTYVVNHLNGKCLRMKLDGVATENQSDGKMSFFFARRHYFHDEPCGSDYRSYAGFCYQTWLKDGSKMVEVLCHLEDALHKIVFCRSGSDDHPFKVSHGVPFGDAILLPGINNGHDCNFSAVTADSD